MKKIFVPLVFALIFFLSLREGYGQTVNQMMYFPDGKKYQGKAKNIKELNKEVERLGRVYTNIPNLTKDDFSTMVGYKLFTKEPLWVITTKPANIQNFINAFDLEEFMNSWMFEFELEKFVENKTLTDDFLLETLGKPSSRISHFDGNKNFEIWTYSEFGVSLTLREGVVQSFVKSE